MRCTVVDTVMSEHSSESELLSDVCKKMRFQNLQKLNLQPPFYKAVDGKELKIREPEIAP